MIGRSLRFAILAAVAAGVAAAVRALTAKDDALPAPVADPTGGPWPPLRNETAAPAPTGTPEPAQAASPEAPTEEPTAGSAWVAPGADGVCPDGHPIKAKLSSKIFHSPGQMNYERTAADRCYVDAAAAEADGFRAAKR